LKYELFD